MQCCVVLRVVEQLPTMETNRGASQLLIEENFAEYVYVHEHV
jgi:hypothetical protein